MTKITSLKDLQNMPVMVRVISTKSNDEEQQDMVGGEFQVRATYNYENTRGVWNKDKSNFWFFNEEDLQVLTPLKFNGVTIGIGDTVDGNKVVYGFHWYNNRWILNIATAGDINYCLERAEPSITSHIPLHTPTPKMSDEALIEELTKRGRLKEGVILE